MLSNKMKIVSCVPATMDDELSELFDREHIRCNYGTHLDRDASDIQLW